MQLGILITNNGTHSPEKWATSVADKIVSVAQTLEGEKLLAAQRLQLAVTEALIAHHDAHQKEILADLETGEHFNKPIVHEAPARAKDALADIVKTSKGTPWESHFVNEETQATLHFYIAQSLIDLAHVERLYWGDKNPDHVIAKMYKANPNALISGPPELPVTEQN